jgi:flavin reductase (DIM6/NTAB) family NADH-FMN oxidoreductase RutF
MTTGDTVVSGANDAAGALSELRSVLSAFPRGVAAVCAQREQELVGMAVSTFTPVSLNPPLISLCIRRTSNTWSRLREAPNVGVSILGENHERVCRQLGSKDGDRFVGVDTIAAPSGSIYVTESCAWFDCSIELEIDAADHLIVMLRVLRTGMSSAAGPLVFHRGRFHRLLEASRSTA